jgi:PPOX class probable F420-dependent enzyme
VARRQPPLKHAHPDLDIRGVLNGTPIAHLATVSPDGSPHSVPVWVATRDHQIVFLTGPHKRKARNPAQDPRVALSIAPGDDRYTPIVIRGIGGLPVGCLSAAPARAVS